jgi:NAD+ kinase
MAGPDTNPFEKIAVAANPKTAEAIEEAAVVAEFLEAEAVEVVNGRLDDPAIRDVVRDQAVDLLIALGGDGTMLRAGHLCAPVDVPVLGINVGHFGFLTEIQRAEWREKLPLALTHDTWFERRMMLNTVAWRGETSLGDWDVVNEAVIGHGRIKRPVHLETFVDGIYLTTFVADGVIVATPTGSTAYALAAGGPILPPELRNILLVPVAPHLSIDRAVVLAEGSAVEVIVKSGHEVVLSIDGQNPIDLLPDDRIEVSASEHNLRFLRLQDPAYFYRNITSYMKRNPAVR